VLRAYQAACTEVIQRFGGRVAQYLGDGLLVYFGYPQAHDDDAQRAVRAGLGIIEAMDTLNGSLAQERGVRLSLRVGVHTGLVVVGAMGGAGRQAQLALGDTPLMAARLQSLAAPDTVVLSETTARLVQGYFTWQPSGVTPSPMEPSLWPYTRSWGRAARTVVWMSRLPMPSPPWWDGSRRCICSWSAGRGCRRAWARWC